MTKLSIIIISYSNCESTNLANKLSYIATRFYFEFIYSTSCFRYDWSKKTLILTKIRSKEKKYFIVSYNDLF